MFTLWTTIWTTLWTSIAKLSINHMFLNDDKCTFYVPTILKTTRSGYHQTTTEFLDFPKNEKVCIISTINVYLKIPRTFRKSKKLLVSLKPPHDAVKTTTIGRWCMETMKDAGIGIAVFTSHSTGSLSRSKAYFKVLSLTMIRKSAGCTADSTFAKLYNKPVHKNFGTLVINTEHI